ncbi:MAG: CDP-alcohol phosphatidyltransferase family protein [Coriobacteriales bacterium]|jgi:cardiolipin synthase|nr:CDP-alcohol phosphatidyltransferase family protein [Coriobacteriales bacterium]
MNNAQTVGFKRHVPNIISMIRIFGTLALPFLMWPSWEQTIVLPIGVFENVPLIWILAFLFLTLTDKLDGTLARSFKVESGFGATLDVIGDALLLVVGASCAFIVFARESLPDPLFWFYVFIMVQILSDKFIVFFITKKYFGTGNALHSIPHKAFAVGAYLAIALWAFVSTIPMWSILLLWAIVTYATIDEIIYLVRSATYDPDFKGHGFEKYPLRKDQPSE